MNNATLDTVREAVADALGLDLEEVEADSTLLDDLGAESIDLLDILYRIAQSTGTKITVKDLAAYIQGDVPEGEFGDETTETILPRGVAQLTAVMPQLTDADLERIRPGNVMTFFTVRNLGDLVSAYAAVA